MGKTRGGRNTKIMALTDGKGRLMGFILVEGQAYEGKHVRALLPKGRKWQVVGDKGFDSDKLRKELESLGHETCFPGKKNRRSKVAYSKKPYRRRYRVENFFCRIKRWACLSLRRDKLALLFSSPLAFAAPSSTGCSPSRGFKTLPNIKTVTDAPAFDWIGNGIRAYVGGPVAGVEIGIQAVKKAFTWIAETATPPGPPHQPDVPIGDVKIKCKGCGSLILPAAFRLNNGKCFKCSPRKKK